MAPRAACLAVLLAVGLTACVDLAPVPENEVGLSFYQPAYPQMVLVPGYPVYYAPAVRANYFFYDGLYWLYQYDNWYSSSWYNGPWGIVGPQYVPYYVLRVPVRYYRAPPPYFRGWRENEPPHWDEQWGRDWEEHHRDWKKWDHRSVPPPAPLPVYQQRYAGDHYPRDADRQQAIRDESYHYAPRDDVTQVRRPPVSESPPSATPTPVQLERRERYPAPASPPPTREVQDQPYPVMQHQQRSPPAPSAPVSASPSSQPRQHQHPPKRPPAATPPPATDTDPPAKTSRSTGDDKAPVDQP